jgi:predicted AlkP superfamily phosphohydrolase/phosphomutase/Tfp pilus assembly protein PilF
VKPKLHPASKVLLIDWDAADWNIIGPLLEKGELPHLNRLIENGVLGRLTTLDLPLPPLAATTLVTGRRPEDHGILGWEEPAENGIDVRPFSPGSRRCKAIWNILTDLEMRCHVIGWPATRPAEKLRGVMLSQRWGAQTTGKQSSRPLADAVSPPDFGKIAAELWMDPRELRLDSLRSFIPMLQPDDPESDKALTALGQAVAMAASSQAAATYLMENEPWDFLAVNFNSLDEIARGFIEFHPPRLAHLSEERFEKYCCVVTEACRCHDQMLGRLVEVAGPETTVILCSTRGVQTGGSRALPDPTKAVNYIDHYRASGFFLISGSSTQKDELVYGATIYDIAPTILALFQKPIPRDLPGRVLAEAFSEPYIPTFVETYEDRAVPEIVRYRAKKFDNESTTPAILAELQNDFHLARCYQASGRHDLALPFLERMHEERPMRVSPALQLIHCYRALGRTADAATLLDHFAARIEADQVTWPASFLPDFNLMRGLLALDQGNAETALSHLQKAESANPQLPGLHIHLGQVYARLRKHRKAEEAFRRALEIDSEHPEAAAGLSAALYRQRRYEEAADYALNATVHAPSLGRNHLQLARCLARLNRDQDALVALLNALRLQPALIEAHRMAVVLYRRTSEGAANARWHRQAIAQLLPLRSQAWKLRNKLIIKLAPFSKP